jgi:hypothetical protein
MVPGRIATGSPFLAADALLPSQRRAKRSPVECGPCWLERPSRCVSSVFARHENTFDPVNQNAQERIGSAVVWEREQNAREQTLAMVRRLLRGPLSARTTAAQIALLNNRCRRRMLRQRQGLWNVAAATGSQ